MSKTINNNTINLKNFCEIYHSKIMEKYKDESFKEVYADCRKYTACINSIMPLICNESLEYYPEYYHIDYTWWTTKDSNNGIVNIYDWELKIVVEHENDKKDWTYEVEKLDFIKAPLKIVIGYLSNKNRRNDKTILEEQVKKLKHLSDKEEFGVILMNNRLEKTKDDPFNMKCYRLMKGRKMKEIEFNKGQ